MRAAYAGEPFIAVIDEPPATKWTTGIEHDPRTARYNPRTGLVLALAALDNLGKGAAGRWSSAPI